MCYDGKNIPEQIPKMVFPLSCYYLTLAPLQFNKRCSEILDCLFRNTEPKKKKEEGEHYPSNRSNYAQSGGTMESVCMQHTLETTGN